MIIPALDVGAPDWAAITIGVLAAGAGHRLVVHAKRNGPRADPRRTHGAA
jgi:hypothetical protein